MNGGPFLVRSICGPMRIPMKLEGSVLFHAMPRESYTRFETEASAEEAIQSSLAFGAKYGWTQGQFEILPVAAYEEELSAAELQREKRKKRVKENVDA